MSYGYLTPATGWTVEIWFKHQTLLTGGTDWDALFNQYTQSSTNWSSFGNSNGRQFELSISSATNALRLQFFNSNGNTGTTLATFDDPNGTNQPYANDNEWHHVAVRMSTNKINFSVFLDGQLLGNGTTSAALNWNPGILAIGGAYSPPNGFFGIDLWEGWLAYAAVFQRPLSDNRILEHYTAGSGGTVFYNDNEVTRLGRILDWARVPDQSREFESNLVNLQGIQVQDANALTALQDTVKAAGGVLFADGQSRIVYHNREHVYNRWTIVTLAESLGAAPETDLEFTLDDETIFNDIRGDRPFGSQIRMQDELSVDAHGPRTYSFSIPVTTHEELQNAVSWIFERYAEPEVRVSTVTLRAESSTVIEWIGTGGVTIGDHITLTELPQEAAPFETMEFIIEKISINADLINKVWAVSLGLSPYRLAEVFEVGTTPLGSRYRLAY